MQTELNVDEHGGLQIPTRQDLRDRPASGSENNPRDVALQPHSKRRNGPTAARDDLPVMSTTLPRFSDSFGFNSPADAGYRLVIVGFMPDEPTIEVTTPEQSGQRA